jgi:hypothetical protein
MDESRGDHRGRLPAGAREIMAQKIKIMNERGGMLGRMLK